MKTSIRMTREDRRIQIIERALGLFREKGYRGTTTAEIAEAANISEVTLFRYFKSKQEIFLAGVAPILQTTLAEVEIVPGKSAPEVRLQALLLNRITFLPEHLETIRPILNEASVLQSMGQTEFTQEIRRLIGSILGASGIPEERSDEAVRMIMGTLLSYLYLPETDPQRIRRHVEHLALILTTAYKE
jgi:AcrR family transcriptional regulator